MIIEGEYLGMRVAIDDLDLGNREYFGYCASHDFHLQRCTKCNLLTYPVRSACPHCSSPELGWDSVEGRGTVHSYSEVHHAVQPSFKNFVPYLILLVELDEQRDSSDPSCAIRVAGNLAAPNGDLVSGPAIQNVGIGSRMRMVFKDITDGLSLPMWTLDKENDQQSSPWRYPIE